MKSMGIELPVQHGVGLRRFLVRLAIVFSLYALSIGPMYWKWFGAKCGLDSPIYEVHVSPAGSHRQLDSAIGLASQLVYLAVDLLAP